MGGGIYIMITARKESYCKDTVFKALWHSACHNKLKIIQSITICGAGGRITAAWFMGGMP